MNDQDTIEQDIPLSGFVTYAVLREINPSLPRHQSASGPEHAPSELAEKLNDGDAVEAFPVEMVAAK